MSRRLWKIDSLIKGILYKEESHKYFNISNLKAMLLLGIKDFKMKRKI
jgi:hypothetical protein